MHAPRALTQAGYSSILLTISSMSSGASKYFDPNLGITTKPNMRSIASKHYSTDVCAAHPEEHGATDGNMHRSIANPHLKQTEWGWTIDPLGLRISLNQIWDRYQIPVMIVENGFGAIDVREEDGSVHDQGRIDYMRTHIKVMKETVEIDGVDLMGYTPWGWIDVVSAGTGEMRKRYGFVYVDMDDDGNGDLSRSRKDSFYYMQKVYKSNGEDLD